MGIPRHAESDKSKECRHVDKQIAMHVDSNTPYSSATTWAARQSPPTVAVAKSRNGAILRKVGRTSPPASRRRATSSPASGRRLAWASTTTARGCTLPRWDGSCRRIRSCRSCLHPKAPAQPAAEDGEPAVAQPLQLCPGKSAQIYGSDRTFNR